MDKVVTFIDEYLEIAGEGWQIVRQRIFEAGWIVLGSLFVVLTFPMWLVGRGERIRNPKPRGLLDDLEEAVKQYTEAMNAILTGKRN